jgi:hypothetical protein
MTTMYDRREYYWGGCPECKTPGGLYYNDGPDHWFVCEVDGVRWYEGSNLFSSWREMSDEDHAYHQAILAGLRPVEAYEPAEIAAVAAAVELLEPDPFGGFDGDGDGDAAR